MRHEHQQVAVALTLCFFTEHATARAQSKRIRPVEASHHVGELVAVCGEVTEFECDPAQHTFLLLGPATSSPSFRIQIPRPARTRFGRRFEDQFYRRDVCVNGRIETDTSGYQIVLSAPDAISIAREPSSPVAVLAPQAFRSCDAGVVLPTLIKDRKPSYAPDAMRDRIQGAVLMQGVVQENGRVGDIQLLRSLDSGLDREAIRAFKEWQFRPGTNQGRPVAVIVTVKMAFVLQ